MIESMVIGTLIFLVGGLMGYVLKVVAVQLEVAAEDETAIRNKRAEKLNSWNLVIPLVTGAVSLITWLQPTYRQAPFYSYLTNIGLVWLFLMIALTDWLTHLIFPRMLLINVMLVGAIWLAVSFLNAPTGLIIDKTSGLTKAVQLDRLEAAKATLLSQFWPLNVYDSLAGAMLIGVVFGLLYLFSRMIARKEVFGKGDVVLASLVGLSLGIGRSLWAIGITAGISLITTGILLLLSHEENTKDQYIAYGPFLCLGAIYGLMFGPVVN